MRGPLSILGASITIKKNTSMQKDFELLAHTADLKIRVYGQTIEQLFRHALIGMFQAIGPKAQGCTKHNDRLICPQLPEQHDVAVEAGDRDALLIDFLSHALSLSDIYNEAYLDAVIHELTDTNLRATIYGVKIQGFEVVEIKAVTYHDLQIKKVDHCWQVDIVFDI